MRLLRLDHLHGGRSLELDPHLTLVLGAPDAVRSAIAGVLRAIVAGEPVGVDGAAELHGIQVGLRGRTFEVGDASWVDPVLDLAAPVPLRLVGGGHRARVDGFARRPDGPLVQIVSTDDAGPDPLSRRGHQDVGPATVRPGAAEHDPAEHTRRVAEEDLVRLRAELRSLDGERSVLARQADEARSGLDSFARATLEVAQGQLEALSGRVDEAGEQSRRWEAERSQRRSELVAQLGRLRSELDDAVLGDATEVREALDRLVELRTPSGRTDPAASALADELEDLRRSMERLEGHRVAVAERLADAEARLVEAEAEAEAALEALRSHDLPSEVVDRLEVVRDEIFDLEERGGPLAGVRARRRIDELRSEEATLLDRLGFDTYTAYVMGRPNRETEALRARRHDRSDALVASIAEEVEQLRAEMPGGAEDRWNREERARIVAAAASLLGSPELGSARLTTVELVELLRSQPERPSAQVSAEVLAASGRLAAALVAVGEPTPVGAADPADMEQIATRWLAGDSARVQRRTELARSIEALERDLVRIDESVVRPDDGGRRADLDAELRAIRSRVAECEERVARHEEATAELAEVRSLELELRDRERDLLVRISDRERLLSVLGVDVTPPSAPVAGPQPSPDLPQPSPDLPQPSQDLPVPPPAGSADVEELRRTIDRDASIAVPIEAEWLLLARLGELRSVGSVGAVPLLLVGLDPSEGAAPALMHRIASMSVLVQTVVLSDDERCARWIEALGPGSTVVRW